MGQARLLSGAIQPYSWGSTTALAQMMGCRVPTKQPQAELWFGTHPRGPAQLLDASLSGAEVCGQGDSGGPRAAGGLASVGLDEVIAADPVGQLGVEVARKFADQLPFMLKVLAVAEPLSLQAHPSRSQAQAGFEAEEQKSIASDAPNRSFVDRNHKPELLCALGPFVALCGFRNLDATAELLGSLGVAGLAPAIELLQAPELDESDRVHRVLAWLWTLDKQLGTELALKVARACSVPGAFGTERRWAVRIAKCHPGDVGVVVALMLNVVSLKAGQAIFLEAGNLHCYLDGVGVEVMSNSDNVLRGGLTQKHINTAALLEVVNCDPGTVSPLTATEPNHTFRPPVAEFCLTRMEVAKPVQCVSHGPEIALCVAGELSVAGQRVASGQAAWIPATNREFEIAGTGLVFRAAAGSW